MALNERENARKDKKRNKDSKTKKIIWIVLAIVVVILVVMRFAEIDFNSIKNHFVDENGKFHISMTSNDESYPYTLDSSKNVKVVSVDDKINILTSSSYTVLEPNNANVAYSFEHGYSNPVLKYAGDYSCLFDQGSLRLRLDSNKENIYETKLEKSILTADVSNKGNVIYATEGDDVKSVVTVINKSLDNLASFDVKQGYVVSVAIDSSGKKLAWAVVNSSNAKLVTTIFTANVGDTEPRGEFTLDDSSVIDLHYASSSKLFVVADNTVALVDSQKELKTIFEADSVHTSNYAYTSDDELIYNYTGYSDSTDSTLVYVKSNGKIKTTINLTQKVKYISSHSNEISVLYDDKIVNYALTDGEEKSTVNCDESVNSVIKLSSKMYVQRQQLIDVCSE